MRNNRYIGTVMKNVATSYGWIDIKSVRRDDGAPHNLKTEVDIFLHITACEQDLRPGMEVNFTVSNDLNRSDAYRAESVFETMESELQNFSQGGIELFVEGMGENANSVEHSSVKVNWCLSTELCTKVKVLQNNNTVMLLLVHWPKKDKPHDGNSRGEVRMLVNPGDAVEIVSFDNAGKSRLFAMLVVANSRDQLHSIYLTKYSGRYDTDVVRKNECGTLLNNEKVVGSGCVDVEIPSEVFAPKPRDYSIVNSWYRTPPKNQCDFRWRRAVYLIYPFYFLWISLKTSARVIGFGAAFAILLALGLHPKHYTPLRHPSTNRYDDIEISSDRSIFVPKIRGRRFFLPLLLNPFVLLLSLMVAYFTSEDGELLARFATLHLLCIGGLLVFGNVISLVIESIDWDTRRRLQYERERKVALEAIEAIACDNGVPTFKLRRFSIKSFRFFFHDTKQKVCRDFSR